MISRRHWRVIVSGVTTLGVAAVAVVTGVGAASGADTTTPETHASSQFLAGSIGGTALDGTILGAAADNTSTSADELDHRALVTAPANPLISLGVANQIAFAGKDGVARALTGAVDDGNGVAPADLTLSLNSVTGGTPLAGVVNDLTVKLGALSSAAAVKAGQTSIASTCADPSRPVNCRDYDIAGGSLTFSAPLIGDLTTQIIGALTPVTNAVNGLGGSNGPLAQALEGVNGITAPLGGLTDLDITATVTLADLDKAVRDALANPLGDGIVSIDLTTGRISVDLDKLVTAATGRALNNQSPNTEVLSKAVIDELTSHVVALIAKVPGQVLAVVQPLIDAAQVNLSANLCVLGAGTAPDCRIAGIADTGTGVAIDIRGTIAQLLAGGGTATSVVVQVLALDTRLPVGDVLGALTPALQTATDTISKSLAPALTTAIGTVTTGLNPALTALPQLLSLRVNVQDQGTLGGVASYVQSALAVSVAGGRVLRLDVARSEVSARLVPMVNPDPTPTVNPDPTPTVNPDPTPTVDPDPVPDPVDDPEGTEPDPQPRPRTTPLPDLPTRVDSGV